MNLYLTIATLFKSSAVLNLTVFLLYFDYFSESQVKFPQLQVVP